MKILFIGLGKNGEVALASMYKHKFPVIKVIVAKGHDNTGIIKIAKKNRLQIVAVSSSRELDSTILEEDFELVVVASFPFLFSKNLVRRPKLGVINIHGSLLPKYRGYHPIHWAIINGEEETGVTVHYLSPKMDQGEILAQKSFSIKQTDDIHSVIKNGSIIGGELLISVLNQIKKEKKKIKGVAQKDTDATFAPKRYPKDGKINWNSKTNEITNLIRALKNPYPNAYAMYGKNKIAFPEVFIPKTAGIVMGKVDGFYIISTLDGVVLVKSKSKMKIGDKIK